jgi:hypothetical protein
MSTHSEAKSTDRPSVDSKEHPVTPEPLRQALKSALTASNELVLTSKSLLQSSALPTPSSEPSHSTLNALSKLASLIHSHTVRIALTCGPTASSPTATLGCIKDLHEPILPIISEYQNLSSAEYPEFFVTSIRRNIVSLLDTLSAFVCEVVEIACGNATVDSRERLQYSGMMLEVCDRIQQVCKSGPISLLRDKLRETEEMLNDALEELDQIIEPKEEVEDGWDNDPIQYSSEQKTFALRTKTKLRLLSLLYKAILKRRISNDVLYDASLRNKVETVQGCLGALAGVVDDLVAGISAQEEPINLELSMVQTIDEARKLAITMKLPLDNTPDGRETWFDTWLAKIV